MAWHSTLTELSCKVEGHSLGKRMLKLEPGESARVLVAILPNIEAIVPGLDALARRRGPSAVEEIVDTLTIAATGISKSDVRRLREAAALLRSRRTGR